MQAQLKIAPGDSILLSREEKRRTDALQASDLHAPYLSLPLSDEWEVTPEGENTLLMEYCRYKKGDGTFSSPLPIIAVQRLLTVENYSGPLTLRYDLQTNDCISNLFLALEDPDSQEIYLDGKQIENKDFGYFYEKSFRRIAIGTLTTGRHTVEIRRHFQPLSRVTNALTQLFEARYGVELEPMYLLGRFTVCAQTTASHNGCITLENAFSLSSAKDTFFTTGEICTEGYPFFVGSMRLKQRFTLPKSVKPENGVLSLGVLNAACAEVFVNGKAVGDICRAPARLPLADALREGENEITIRLFTTLHNVIGPFHRPLGNVGNTFGGGYKNPDAAWLSVDTTQDGWHEHLEDFYPTWTNDYNVVPLGIKDASIVVPIN